LPGWSRFVIAPSVRNSMLPDEKLPTMIQHDARVDLGDLFNAARVHARMEVCS
jgi:hypothetical protein